jgi:hypothetical protein
MKWKRQWRERERRVNKEREAKHSVAPTDRYVGTTVTEDGTTPTSSTKVRNQRESSESEKRIEENMSI